MSGIQTDRQTEKEREGERERDDRGREKERAVSNLVFYAREGKRER